MNKDFYVPDVFRAFTVGFEEPMKVLDTITKTAQKMGYPPYNIVKTDDNKYVIELAVAGFGKQDLSIELKENSLIVSGSVTQDTENNKFLYKGIADRAFTRTFNLADTIEIKNTELVNGMLKVFLENIVPEHKKSRKIDIK